MGCSHLNKKNTTLNQSLSKICLSGEGKGRIQWSGGRHVFNFESLNNKDKDLWSLALNLPIFGEEVFHLGHKKALKGKVVPKGNFWRRLEREMRQSKKGRTDFAFLKSFILRYGQLIKIKNKPSLNTKEYFTWSENDGHFIVTFKIPNQPAVEIDHFALKDGFYGRQSVRISMPKNNYSKRQGFVFDLFMKNCTVL